MAANKWDSNSGIEQRTKLYSGELENEITNILRLSMAKWRAKEELT